MEKNRCLRMPRCRLPYKSPIVPKSGGDSNTPKCFVDGNDKLNGVAGLNKYKFFWQTEMICSQARFKTDPEYDLRDNRCCTRDHGLKFHVSQQSLNNVILCLRLLLMRHV